MKPTTTRLQTPGTTQEAQDLARDQWLPGIQYPVTHHWLRKMHTEKFEFGLFQLALRSVDCDSSLLQPLPTAAELIPGLKRFQRYATSGVMKLIMYLLS